MYLERKEELEEEVLPYLESRIERKKEELKKLKILEKRELQKTIEIEMPEPIVIPSQVNLKKNGSVTLKSKVIRTSKGYISRKLPNEKKDLEGWKRVRREKLGASDLVKMVNPRYESGIIDLFLERLHNQEKVFSTEAQEKMGIGKFLEELLEYYECYLGFCYLTLHHREIRERVWEELKAGKINLKTSFQMQGGRR